jgi:hypothetical protein
MEMSLRLLHVAKNIKPAAISSSIKVLPVSGTPGTGTPA